MTFRQFLSGMLAWAKYHKGEICATGAVVCSIGAVGFAIYETPKAQRRIKSNKEEFNNLKLHRDSDEEYKVKQYKKDLAKHSAKTVGNVLYDYKGTIACEAASILFTVIGCKSMRKVITATSSALATTTGILAMTEEAIRQEYGEDALLKIKELRSRPIHKKISVVNPETEEIEEKLETMTPPDTEWLDENARDFLMNQPAEVRARFDPTSTVLLDEGSQIFRTSHGDLDILTANIKGALKRSNMTMWKDGRILLRAMVDDLEFLDMSGKRWNQDILNMAGTIDMPICYDYVSKKYIRTKGFDENGVVNDRKQYGEYTHKYLSYGEEQDKYFFARPEAEDHPYFIIDGRILLELSYDGNIAALGTGTVPNERKRSAWIENPEIEK